MLTHTNTLGGDVDFQQCKVQFVTANEKNNLFLFGVVANKQSNEGLLTEGFRVRPPFRLDEGSEKEEMKYRPCEENYGTVRFYSKTFAYSCHAFEYSIISFVHGNQACCWGNIK